MSNATEESPAFTKFWSWLCLPVLLALVGAANAQLVSGLEGASGSAVGPDGALYVTEGAAGRITRIDPVTGDETTFASNLPPSYPAVGIGGAMDVAFLDGTAYALVSLVGDPAFFGGSPPPNAPVDGVYRIDGPDSWTVVANIGAWAQSNPPDPSIDFFLVNGVQYALEPFRGGFLVTDGHHNRVLNVTLDGGISEFKAFGNIVPTGLAARGHTVFMAEAGPLPHDPEDGKIVAIDAKTRAVSEVASGAWLLVDVEFGPGGILYGLSQGIHSVGDAGSPADPFTGSLVRARSDGGFDVLTNPLNLPTSLEFIGNSAYVVTLTGEVWSFPKIAVPHKH
jgi:hypothetical protein